MLKLDFQAIKKKPKNELQNQIMISVILIDFEANCLILMQHYQNHDMGNRQCSNGPIIGMGNKVEWSEKPQQIAAKL